MKLRTKIFITFTIALIINIFVVIFGMVYVLDSLSEKLMKKQAENITLFLQHRVINTITAGSGSSAIPEIAEDFITGKQIADESRSFDIKKILLIKPDFTIEASFPVEEKGKSYASHRDIRESFTTKGMATVLEDSDSDTDRSKTVQDIDVVSWFTLKDGSPRVIEVKLDFAKSIAMLESQYSLIETGAIIVAVMLLVSLLGVLLLIVGRTAVRPVLKVAEAMEKVGSGDLDVRLPQDSGDEFGQLALRFNEMVLGLREKFRLYRYLSDGTIQAVRDSLGSSDGHKTSKRELALFFSDIRGFTTYSESKDPAVVISTLNRIFTIQSSIIKKYGGDIDKFVGDEVMAVFTDPAAAVDSAIEIQKEMESESHDLEDLRLGIGIHFGEVVQGDVGSDRQVDFTVIGDNVNTASRLQAMAGGGRIIVSADMAYRPEVSGRYELSPEGEVKLKGKEIAIKVFSVNSLR